MLWKKLSITGSMLWPCHYWMIFLSTVLPLIHTVSCVSPQLSEVLSTPSCKSETILDSSCVQKYGSQQRTENRNQDPVLPDLFTFVVYSRGLSHRSGCFHWSTSLALCFSKVLVKLCMSAYMSEVLCSHSWLHAGPHVKEMKCFYNRNVTLLKKGWNGRHW